MHKNKQVALVLIISDDIRLHGFIVEQWVIISWLMNKLPIPHKTKSK